MGLNLEYKENYSFLEFTQKQHYGVISCNKSKEESHVNCGNVHEHHRLYCVQTHIFKIIPFFFSISFSKPSPPVDWYLINRDFGDFFGVFEKVLTN